MPEIEFDAGGYFWCLPVVRSPDRIVDVREEPFGSARGFVSSMPVGEDAMDDPLQ